MTRGDAGRSIRPHHPGRSPRWAADGGPAVDPLTTGLRATLAQPGLGRYLGGQALSMTGTWMQTVALAWLAFDLTGSPAAVGVAMAARSLPILVLAVPAGVLGDRFERRALIVAASVVGLAAALIAAAVIAAGWLTFPLLVAMALVAGTGNAFEAPNFNAFLGQLAGRHLVGAIAVNGLAFNLARIIGPAIGGILLAGDQAALVFALNGLSYLAFIAIMTSNRPATPFVRPTAPGGAREGLAHVLGDAHLAVLLGLLAIHTMTLSVPVILAAPIAADLGGGAAATGLLVSALGSGAIVSLGVLGLGGDRFVNGGGLLLTGLVSTFCQVVLALADALPLALAAMVGCGIGLVGFTAICNALIQTIVPDALRARLMSFYAIVLPGTAPIAALVSGWIAGAIGTDATLLIGALSWLAVMTATAVVSTGFRTLTVATPVGGERARQG